ncbi:hypothetical protein [Piscinibacter koreensis]|uniref:Uncharacterized protein n=1 Tax=Piscinibacter koreensis TaxID=2742824 RepID=A0A7Y6NQW0_9BURK|nr:hypothetical protein [Schlegelella koreensis]NUZ07644.1 hypothetical protein [Schlegelella koreensis]
MASKIVPKAEPGHRVEWIAKMLEEIAGVAHHADRLAYFADVPPDEASVVLVDALRNQLCRIGWIAETCLAEFEDADPIRGTAEAWLLSPVCQREASHG